MAGRLSDWDNMAGGWQSSVSRMQRATATMEYVQDPTCNRRGNDGNEQMDNLSETKILGG